MYSEKCSRIRNVRPPDTRYSFLSCRIVTTRVLHLPTYINYIQCDSFGTRPKKMRISQRLFIRFWTCIYDYIPCFMRSMSILEEMLEMFATTVQACSKSNEKSLRYSHFLGSSTERITLYISNNHVSVYRNELNSSSCSCVHILSAFMYLYCSFLHFM